VAKNSKKNKKRRKQKNKLNYMPIYLLIGQTIRSEILKKSVKYGEQNNINKAKNKTIFLLFLNKANFQMFLNSTNKNSIKITK
jgi:hypothetical protein